MSLLSRHGGNSQFLPTGKNRAGTEIPFTRYRYRLVSSAVPASDLPSMNEEDRIQAVSQFLLQSPPGEINDVLNGIVELLFIYP
jgi:hypothetical protein